MATLVLSAVGSLVGGPVGGSIGALIGRQIDGEIFGDRGRREGPRLDDLKITTSSYGMPLPRHFGRMRVAGSVIWATDLVEDRETSDGGKGKPKTTSYSYSTSFAVALASRPIARVGRVWADGNLLRGAAGDLKCQGTLRVHCGYGDQPPDPLIASAAGSECPAFRGCAYVVFESLALADFGNRIPALTFEVFADEGTFALSDLVNPLVDDAVASAPLPGLEGFSYQAGDLGDCLATLGTLYPLRCDAGGSTVSLAAMADGEPVVATLPEAVAGDEDDFGAQAGRTREVRGPARGHDAVRYYDTARDYQAGVQRAEGVIGEGADDTLDFPGALGADSARGLVTALAHRERTLRQTYAWRVAQLDPAIAPGAVVALPDEPGRWRVIAWEWRECGIELELVRLPPASGSTAPGASGQPGLPPDVLAAPTWLRAFELPWDGAGSADVPAIFAAPSSAGTGWRGAALYVDNRGVLEPIGSSGRTRSVSGSLSAPLPPSPALLLERGASIELELVAPDLAFAPASVGALANGANRLLVGNEIVQFAEAWQTGESSWRLAGLLRGRGGTEAAAMAGHAAGTPTTLVDDALVSVPPGSIDAVDAATIAAIGQADPEPVTAPVENIGVTRRPLVPVHPRARIDAAGDLSLGWTRRARGAWTWTSGIDVPLVEETERYRIGVGPTDAPVAAWEVAEPTFEIPAAELASLRASNPGAALWVCQLGSFARSDPLLLYTLD